VAYVSHLAALDGAERCLIESIDSIRRDDVEGVLILPNRGPLGKYSECAIEVCPHPLWIYTRVTTGSWLKRVLRQMKVLIQKAILLCRIIVATLRLCVLFRRIKPDVVLSNTVSAPAGAIAAYILSIPHVWYIHEFVEEDHGMSFSFGKKFSLRIINRFSKRILFNSKKVSENFSKYFDSEKASILYYVVEVPQESIIKEQNSDLDPTALKLGLFGRKVPSKGQELAIRAQTILKKKGLNTQLWLVGSGPAYFEEELKGLSLSLGLADSVKFVSFLESPLKLMSQMDVLLMCSRFEAFGRVTIEAMKLGVPVIGSDSGATSELVEDNFNGFLFKPNNAQDLAEKIERLVEAESRKTLGINAKKWATETFNKQKHGRELLKVFEEILSKKIAKG
jgi:glycosyltransferase involved in cell wall biosynthesis